MQKWKVEFYGEGTSWEYTGLSFAASEKKVDSCPQEYMAFMAPYDEEEK
ncbi:MAG: hypothetical protein [Caudoviricetes sp.]|nr:MAG: hypothetical protein [Caudoviricetes sp.]